MKYFLTTALFFFSLCFTGMYAQTPSCNAGTITLGPIVGQSNDVPSDTIFLCFGDSMFVDHNGDQVFNDPDPATPAGIAYAFYQCPPTMTGNDAAVLSDPCLWPGNINGFFITKGPPSGDHGVLNNNLLVNSPIFGSGNPVLIYFAPITVTDYANGILEPGCVDVGIDQTFATVFLRKIWEKNPANGVSSVSTNFGDDCKSRFRLWGGFPEWALNETYKIDISLAGNPVVKGFVYTVPAHWKHGFDVIFSVPEPGVYNVKVEDGKSCGLTFLVDMSGCDASDNAVLSLPKRIAQPGARVCLPLTASRTFLGASFSLSWDTSVLRYDGVRNAHPVLKPGLNLNTSLAGAGKLGVAMTDPSFTGAVPPYTTLLELCFDVLGATGTSSPVNIDNSVIPPTFDTPLGDQAAISVHNGLVLVKQIVSDPPTKKGGKLSPNPVRGGDPVFLEVELPEAEGLTFMVYDLAGRAVSEQQERLTAGYNRVQLNTTGLPAGYYVVVYRDSRGQVFEPTSLIVGH